jgi:hypothetical protein
MADENKVGTLPYVFSFFSFIPGIGLFFGLGFIVYGLTTKKVGGKIVAGIGTVGILCTILIYSLIVYQFIHGGIFFKGFSKMTESNLSDVVVHIEFYKTQNGKYPESLEVLQQSLPKDSIIQMEVIDMTNPGLPASGKKANYFYYQVADSDHYYLLGVGPDGIPFTCDDLLPKLDPAMKTGLLIKKPDCPATQKQP